MPFVEGGIVVDAEPQQQAAPTMAQGGFVQGGIEVDPTPEDSYNKVLQFQAAQTDYTPSKQEFLDYLKVSKTKPLLGEKPLETIGTAAAQTAVDIATMPYKLGEAIGEIYQPPEGATEGDVALGTAAEIAAQSKLKAQSMARGAYDVALSNLEKLTGKLRSDDDRYEAFLATSEIKRQLARANAPEEERVPAAQEFLQAYNIPQEALSQPGLEVGGFLADPSSIAFAGGGKAASMLLQRAAPLIPRAGAALQRGGERITALGRAPETGAGAFAARVTGSPQMGQAVQEAIARGTTGVALGEAAGLPITAQLNVPGLGTASRIIGGTKAAGATMETLGEAGAISGGQALTPIQRGLLGAGERIAAAEGASAGARAFGTALARSGLETPIKTAASILIPAAGAAVGGGLLAGLTGEEGEAVAAAVGSGLAFGGIDAGFRLAKAASSGALNGGRVRQTAVDDLNTRPTEVQFTYIDPDTGAEQLSTIKDSEARAKLYAGLDNKQLTKALSEVAGAENSGVEVIFHGDGDAVPTSLQSVNYAGVSIGPDNIKSGKPTILINVDRAKPETLPHEILHARITGDVVSRLGSQVIETSAQSPEFQRQFTDFANRYADKLQASGAPIVADRIRTELRDAFDPALQRAQRIEQLKRMTDEFAAYYTQEFLKGKDPKTLLPGRIPSFFELAFNNAKEAVSERFTRQALQNGFDPVARTFYDANGKRIKIPWMEDAIKNLVTPKEGYEPTEQRVDINKLTQAQQNAVIMARGYSDLFMTGPDGSIIRPLSKAELAAKTADVANRTMQVIETVPQNERGSVSGLDAKGNPIIEGRLSLAEADAVSKSGIFSPSTSRSLIDIATAIRDGTLMEGRYWKVYGSTGKSGVFGESEKLFLPYGISINSKGGVNIKAVDWGKVQARMYKALTKAAYKNLFGNYDQAMSTLKDVYLKNIAEQNAAPSAEALGGGIEGAKKRNFFNEVMGAVPKKGDTMINLPTAGYEASRKGGSVYQDLRIERIQNTNTTGTEIPWSGDMGEQSSYRRTQLNFQPAEQVGETSVQSDLVGGYRILSKGGKFRLYGPDGSTAGIFDTEGQAKLKAEKDYATQARLQPEVRQQQYPARDEVRQTAEAGGGDSNVGRTQGREEGGQELGAVRQAGDVIQNFDALVAAAPDVRFMPVESQPENAPVAGRITKGQQASIDELSQYYASKTPDRAKVLKSDAIDSLASRLINKGVPVQEANAIASKTFSKLRKGVSGALQVISGMGLSDLSRMAGTGKPSVERRPHINQNWLTSAFEAFATDEGLALMKAQQVATQLNKADQAKAAAGESVEAARASGVRQSTMQQGMEFVLGEMNADRKAFGTSLREDLDSPPRVYASVGEGQKFGGQGNYNVFFEWKKETPMVVTSHHHYGVANGVTGIHAQGNIGDKNARSFGNPSAEKYDTLPSGKQVLDTHLLVGNQGVPDARAHQLTVSIPDSSLSGIRSVYKEKGAAGVEAELNRIAVSQMVGTKSQGKTKAFTSKEGIPPMVAIQKNRTEAYVLNPDLANVASVTIVSNSPKEVALIRKNLENAFANNGSALPKVKVVSAESGASGNVGRKAITDEYFKLTGEQRFMPSSLTARDINAIASEVGGGDVKGGAKAFGAFMRSMRDKGITLRDVVKSYGITLSSIQRQELPVSTIKKNWPDAPFQEGTKVRPEDAFAQLLGTPEGQKYLDAAESGVFDEQAADAVVQKFRSFGFHNKLKEQMKTAVEQFYPKAQEIIDAVNTMPTDKFIDYVRNNFKGISYGKVGFWSGQLGRGDIPTFDSRQGKLVYGKEVPVTKQVLMEQKDRLTQLGINVPAAFKDFAQTLLHHEVWDRLNQSDTEHGPIKEAMLRFMPSDTDYLSAVQQGDTQAAQRMVDEAAKAAGYTVGPVWHGTRGNLFTVFDKSRIGTQTAMPYDAPKGFYFSKDQKLAERYGPNKIRAFVKGPFLLDNSKIAVVESSGQIKSADPITRDDAGNVIPLSQRFKATSEDIRYMPAGDMASGRSVKDHREAMDLFEKGYRLYGALYDGMEDPVRLKKATEIERFDPENLWAVPPRRVAAAIAIRNMPADMMPQPDSSMPGAYSFQGGYRAIPGKTKGSFRLYGPAGSLIGIASSLDEAQRILRRKNK